MIFTSHWDNEAWSVYMIFRMSICGDYAKFYPGFVYHGPYPPSGVEI